MISLGQLFAKVNLASIGKRYLDQLTNLTFDQVASLPERIDETLIEDGHEIAICTYRNVCEDGTIHVIFQAYFYRTLGMGDMWADGFGVKPTGEHFSLPAEEYFEYR